MPAFLELWLPLVGCTLLALAHKIYGAGRDDAVPVLILLAAEAVTAVLWGIYWMVLYPAYFTPFRHLPTPAVSISYPTVTFVPRRVLKWATQKRSWLRGNRTKLLADNPWIEVGDAVRTLPNTGLIRYYETFSREVLVVTSVDAIREMNSVKPYDFGHPKQVKYMLGRITSSNFNFLSEHGHKIFRKNLRPAFTVQHTKKLVPVVWQKSQEMVQLIQEQLEATPDAVVDLRDYIRRTMWDTSGLAMFGHDFETLSHPERGIRDRFALLLAEFSGPAWVRLVMYFFDLRPLVSALSPLVTRATRLGKALVDVRAAIEGVVADNEKSFRAAGKEDLNITSISVASGVFPHTELVDNGMLFLTAGPNSTGTAIEWALYELGRRPAMQTRLREEIRAGLGTANDGVDIGSKLASLPFLNAVCSEVIRCYPFVPLSPKVTERDTTLLGVRLLKDTPLAVPVEALNRDPALWGADADDFNPERWLGDGDRALTGGASSNFAMLSFGAGPNICIGQNQARAFLACCVAAVVQQFVVRLANEDTAGRLRAAPYKKSEEGPLARLTPV